MSEVAHIEALARTSLVCSDLDRTRLFYGEALGFTASGRGPLNDPAWYAPMGLRDTRAERLVMTLGKQVIEFLCFDPPGKPYPADSTSTDLWFQHMAIVVADMDAAYGQIGASGAIAISRGGPERLPPSTGSVSAYKFRDPDGHPLELLHFPPGTGDPRWQTGTGALHLGIDHSAISVGRVTDSLAFYVRRLGLTQGPASVNRGPEQARLDDVPDASVDVVALAPTRSTPHVELLGYRTGSRRPIDPEVTARDVAATQLVFRVSAAALDEMAGPDQALVALAGGRGAARLKDPDGHWIVLESS